MNKFRFVDWKVYKDSKKLFGVLIELTKSLPKEYRFEISSQLIRSGLSVVLNIAEGCGKNSDRELNRYLDISLGSLFEVMATVDTLHDIKLIDKKSLDEIYCMVDEISKQLGGMKKKIKAGL